MANLGNIRYGYFDALRGFSMILVVFHHVMLSIGIESEINHFFYSFFLPLFFFISGFFAYKPLELWNKFQIKKSVTRKFKVQIIGATIFHFLFIIFILNRFPDKYSLLEPDGYWFTYVLFRIFIVYLAIVLLSKATYHSEKNFWILLFFVTLCCIGLNAYYYDFIKLLRWSNLSELILYQLFYKLALYWFPYFAFGVLFRAKLGILEKILSHDSAKTIIIITNIIIWSLIALGYPLQFEYSPSSYPVRILSMILIMQFFYSIKSKFDTESFFSKTTGLIGRRTLDIYFIHYFILPNLSFLRSYIIQDSVLLTLIIGVIVSSIIIVLSLLVGQIIRMSSTTAEWLLGVK